MKKTEFIYINSGSTETSKKIEEDLVSLIRSSKNILNSRLECMEIYKNVVNSLDLPQKERTVYIIKDINPILSIVQSDNIHKPDYFGYFDYLSLPICGDGLVVVPGIDDPCYPTGYDKKRAKFVKYFPSIEHSIIGMGSDSPLCKITKRSILKEFVNHYNDRNSGLHYEFEDAIASPKFRIKNFKIWGEAENVFNIFSIDEAIFRGSGLQSYVNYIVSGVNHVDAGEKLKRKLSRSAAVREKIRMIFSSIERNEGTAHLLKLWKQIEKPIDFKDSMRFMAELYSSEMKKNPATAKADVLLNLLSAIVDQDKKVEYRNLCESIFEKKELTDKCNKRQAAKLYKIFEWPELLPLVSVKDKRDILSNDLGI